MAQLIGYSVGVLISAFLIGSAAIWLTKSSGSPIAVRASWTFIILLGLRLFSELSQGFELLSFLIIAAAQGAGIYLTYWIARGRSREDVTAPFE